LNCGGINKVSDLGGELEEWIPAGYDIYCIGFQECRILKELRYDDGGRYALTLIGFALRD